MNISRRACALTILVALASLSMAPSVLAVTPAKTTRTAPAQLPTRADTHVYMMRGLFGVFSQGIDALAVELNQTGYQAEVYDWDGWEQVAALIAQRYQGGHRGPVVIIGHSLGANAVINVATSLQVQSIPVELGVTFDATDPGQVPENVLVFINFWARDGFGEPVTAVPDYTGQLQNFDLSGQPGIDHTSIDSLDQFHQYVIGKLDDMTAD
ncbi:MAG TPA: alpha/beta hydrolase [Ancylobacter sp.]